MTLLHRTRWADRRGVRAQPVLATFSPESRALIEPYASVVDFDLGSVVNASGADVEHSYSRSARP